MPFLTAGDPNIEESTRRLVKAGRLADVLEIGIPFSDPVADGPTLQKASQRALESGMTPAKTLALVADVHRQTDVPIVVLTYVNPVLRWGADEFFRQAKASGVDGIVVPDLPFEESASLHLTATKHSIALIALVAPTTGDARLQALVQAAEGFIYCVAVLGVTGARQGLSDRAAPLLDRVRAATDVPCVLGFGIADHTAATKARQAGADGVIVGSALADALEGLEGDGALTRLEALLTDVQSGAMATPIH